MKCSADLDIGTVEEGVKIYYLKSDQNWFISSSSFDLFNHKVIYMIVFRNIYLKNYMLVLSKTMARKKIKLHVCKLLITNGIIFIQCA